MIDIQEMLRRAVEAKASDILVVAGLPITFKLGGRLQRQDDWGPVFPDGTAEIIMKMYELASRQTAILDKTGEDDFSFSVKGLSRFRVNTLKQRGSLAAVVRIVSFDLPSYKDLGIPENVMNLSKCSKGLILVSGQAGSGKTTTLACIIDAINKSRNAHIITIEDPIEYLHRHNQSVVTQRELSIDTQNYDTALRAALRQAPDVILLGEMRDHDTIRSVITAAETGHMILSTLHTVGAANTIERIIDIFPPGQQQQIRVQLALVLQGIASQQLVKGVDGHMVPAFEVMTANAAISNMIRESKGHQIESVIYSSSAEGMITMDTSLFNLVRDGRVSAQEALNASLNREQLSKRLMAAGHKV